MGTYIPLTKILLSYTVWDCYTVSYFVLFCRMAEVRCKFQEYDQDGNGSVSAQEAHDILRKELSFTPEQSIKLVQRYDKNGDGQLSYEEFVRFYNKVKSK